MKSKVFKCSLMHAYKLKYCYYSKLLMYVLYITSFFPAIFVLLAVLIWAGSEHYGSGEALNWPFAFACACFISYTICGIFLYLEMRTPVEGVDNRDDYYPY